MVGAEDAGGADVGFAGGQGLGLVRVALLGEVGGGGSPGVAESVRGLVQRQRMVTETLGDPLGRQLLGCVPSKTGNTVGDPSAPLGPRCRQRPVMAAMSVARPGLGQRPRKSVAERDVRVGRAAGCVKGASGRGGGRENVLVAETRRKGYIA
ncbi:hypothetical protein [Frankia sp. R82]|uniref:hypothetical protein n=1 Tax=Frankia sp. R82 TaxID=2950553 RepID=UPI002044452B|nr:hypothetical protein [Frankia sp. R82]MCM3885777.1 hypothetical protein [Frankia sp. R82]